MAVYISRNSGNILSRDGKMSYDDQLEHIASPYDFSYSAYITL